MAEGRIPVRRKPAPIPKFHSDDKFTVDVTEICTNVKYKYQFLSMDRIGDIKDIKNWKETSDVTDAWFDHNKDLRKYAYFGEKTRKDNAIRNFVTHALAIKTYGQRAAEKAFLESIREKYSERRIEIYNMSAVIAYLASAPGVTIPPDELVPLLNVKKMKKAVKSFRKNRKMFYYAAIDKAIKEFEEETQNFEDSIKDRLQFVAAHPTITENPPGESKMNLRSMNATKKVYGFHFANRALKIREKKYDQFGIAFWNFRLKSKEANDYLFDFMMTYLPNLCKVNPIPTGEKPTLESP